mgnify:CR=1 FL=1
MMRRKRITKKDLEALKKSTKRGNHIVIALGNALVRKWKNNVELY